ncbi:F-box/LRR-repeat protein At3g48880 isoform X1 [Hevea brasiliensis]|uniref:F-box/LRR-repeat protein At3g48880 isoform X1 n=2 Tax=Hevea brasiliensis TaxID=3981 RepID=UPI0025EC37F4|nr:F-box/LRR-repeat protein At3g48880 isoform X1 [Hevea brasiliensis]
MDIIVILTLNFFVYNTKVIFFLNARFSRMASNKKRNIDSCSVHDINPVDERRWEEFDINILREIFSILPNCDLFCNVSSVCQSWMLVCWDILFWRHNMLDLTPVLEASANFNFRFQKSMSKLLSTVMEGHDANGFSLERWRLSVKTVVIPKGLDITDEHLLYIAKRTPNLEDLVLEGTYKITEKGFADAICNWKKVQHIVLPLQTQESCFAQIIQAISENCSELETLYVINPLEMMRFITADIAETLCRMKTLVTLVFEGACLYREAINMIFDECLKLETLHIRDCCLMADGLELAGFMTANIRLGEMEIGSGRLWRIEGIETRGKPDQVSYVQKKFMQWRNESPGLYFDIELNDENALMDDDNFIVL